MSAKENESIPDQTASSDGNDVATLTEKYSTEYPEKNLKALESQPESSDLAQQHAGTRRVLLFFGLSMAMFMASLNSTMVSPALSTIAADLNDQASMTWVATGYVLAMNAAQPLYGKFSDIFGRKLALMAAIVLFVVGSIGCALTPNMVVLIIFRAIQGLGGGGIVSLVIIVVSDIYTLEERPRYQSIIMGVYGLSSVIGPLMGGAFVDHLSWRWDFWINLIVGGLAIVGILFFLKRDDMSGSLGSKLKRLDYLGTLFEVGTVVSLLLALTWGGSKYAWNSGTIIGLFVSFVVCLMVFVGVEGWVAKEPLIPGHMFKRASLVLSFIGNFFLGFGFLGALFYTPVLFQIAYATDATASGIRMIPLMLSFVVAGMICAFLLKYITRYKIFIMFGSAVYTLGYGLMYTLDEFSPVSKQIGFLILIGIGLGCSMQNNILSAQATAAKKDMAVATALCQFMSTIGGSVGVAIYDSVFRNAVQKNIAKLDPQHLLEAAKYGVFQSYLKLQSLPPHLKPEFVDAYVSALQMVFLVAIPFSAVSFFCALFLNNATVAEMQRKQEEEDDD